MPNGSGVFYSGGKFHISKLTTDQIDFIGSVSSQEGAGTLADTYQSGGADETLIMPTATEVVDYVLSKVNTSSTALQDELDKLEIAVWGSDIEGNTYSWSNVSSAGRAVGSTDVYYDVSGKQALTYGGSSGSWTKASGDSLAEWLEAYVSEVKTAFEAAEDGDDALQTLADAHESALGLNQDGSYSAHAAPASSMYEFQDTDTGSAFAASAYADIDDALVTNAKLAREALRALIQVNYDNFKVLIQGQAVDLDQLKELVNAYQLADTEVISAITQIVDKTGLSIDNGLADLGDQINPVVGVVELTGASGTSASGNTTKSAPATLASASLRVAVESRSNAILVEIAEVQEELDTTQTGAGLEADGQYLADATRQYLAAASSLKNADSKLDDEIKTVNERLSDKHGTESVLDYTSFDSNGALGNGGNARTQDFALSADYNVVDALNELASFAGSSIDATQLELDRTQANLGIDDSAMAAMALTTNKIFAETVATTFASASDAATSGGDTLRDIIVEMRDEADSAFGEVVSASGLNFELNTPFGIEYTANGSANYIQTASTLKDADDKLDAALKTEADKIVRIILGAGLESGVGIEGTYVSPVWTASSGAALIGAAASLKDADIKIDAAMKAMQDDIFISGGQLAQDFVINGVTKSTIEDAINALSSELGENDLDFEIYNSAAAVATNLTITESETLRFESVIVPASSHDNIVLSSTQTGKGVGIQMKEEPTFKSMDVDESVSAAISAYSINVQHEPFIADEAMDAGDVVCIQKGGSRLFGIEKADIGDANKLEILGLAFNPASTTGGITGHTFAAGDTVAIVVGKQNVEGVSFASVDQNNNALTYAVGDALYLGVDNNGNGVITKAIAVDDSNVPFDAKAVISLGFVTAVNGTNSATANAMWFEPKLVAMDA